MEVSEKEMRKYISNYRFNIQDLDKAERINDYYTKVTANYDLQGGSSGGGSSSKVENFVIKKEKEFKPYEQLKFEIVTVEYALGQLKGKQKEIMNLYIFGTTLIEIKNRLGMKRKSNVWNLKERAIKNMVKYANNNTKSIDIKKF